MTLTIHLDDHTLRYLEREAREQGLPDATAYAAEALRRLSRTSRSGSNADASEPSLSRGQRAVERLRNAQTNGMTADDLMEMTRSEV